MEQIEAALPQLAETRKSKAILSQKEVADLMVLTPWDEYQMALQMSEVTARPPFINQFDHSARQAASQKQVEDLGKHALATGHSRCVFAALRSRLAEDAG